MELLNSTQKETNFWTGVNQGYSEVHRVLIIGYKLFLFITDKKCEPQRFFILGNCENSKVN